MNTIFTTWKKINKHLFSDGTGAFHDWWSIQLSAKTLAVVFTPNPEQVVQASEDPAYQDVLLGADQLLPDGVGLLWALRLAGISDAEKIRERITGLDIVAWWLQQAGPEHEVPPRTLLLGSQGTAAARLAWSVDPNEDSEQKWCRGTAGYTHAQDWITGQLSVRTNQEDQEVCAILNDWRPEVVFVAFGAPTQEWWVERHRAVLKKAGVKIVMVCGGSFDVLVGDINRAPAWMRGLGIEWLYRLLQEPSRWRRQLRLVRFMGALIRARFERASLE